VSADRGGVTRPEAAARRIAEVAGSVSPGTRLGTKGDIRRMCGVSVGTFNEALRLAQSRGLVEVRPGPGGGLFAAEQPPLVRLGNSVLALNSDENSVSDAIRIRDHLDELIISDAAWHSSPADLARYRAQVAAMAESRDRSDSTAFMQANWRLHELLAQVNPSPMLRMIYLALLDVIRSHAVEVHAAPGHTVEELLGTRYQVHAALVDAIAGGDPDRLRHAIAEHSVDHTNDYERHLNAVSAADA
jgi:DNA-binding FadR family transcriptional regulator